MHERFETERVLAELADPAGPTLVSLVPTTLARLLDGGLRDPPALRHALVGGAPLPAALRERALAAGVPLAETYGLTEACSQVTTFGVPLFCTRVALSARGRDPGQRADRRAPVPPAAAHRRPRPGRPGRAPRGDRSQRRHDHHRGRERGARGGRGRAPGPSGRRRGRRARAGRQPLGGGRRRHRRAAARRERHRTGAARALRAAAGRLQGAQGGDVRRGAAAAPRRARSCGREPLPRA